jgi:putative transposase
MNPVKNRRNRRSVRLQGYDYTQAGAYFVTVCTFNRGCLLGCIEKGKMVLSPFGAIAESEWKHAQEIRKNVEIDEFTIMPNHIHGIIFIHSVVGATRRVAPTGTGDSGSWGDSDGSHGPVPGSVGAIIGQYKSAVSRQINRLRGTTDQPIWQRNYYEHVIRSEKDLSDIRQYIRNNPLKWEEDRENPGFAGTTRRVAPTGTEIHSLPPAAGS